jgi:hypothetical protein
MSKEKTILKEMPSVKMGLDDFYGRQTVLKALKAQQKEIDQLKNELKKAYNDLSNFS